MKNSKWLKVFGAVVFAIAIIFVARLTNTSEKNEVKDSVADNVINSGELRLGYVIYSPFLYKDESGKLTGIFYEIAEAAAKKLNIKTNWVEEVGWGTAIEGLKSKRYDIVGTQMWPDSARAREAVFSKAPFNSVLYPYVRAEESRFSDDLSKINSDAVTVITTEGSIDASIAKDDYPSAKLVTLPQMTSPGEVFLNVVDKKADVTFFEPAVADAFMKSNPGKIQQLGNSPVRTFGNAFTFARGEESMVSMWNIAMDELINDGTISRILKKYNVSDYYSLNK